MKMPEKPLRDALLEIRLDSHPEVLPRDLAHALRELPHEKHADRAHGSMQERGIGSQRGCCCCRAANPSLDLGQNIDSRLERERDLIVCIRSISFETRSCHDGKDAADGQNHRICHLP